MRRGACDWRAEDGWWSSLPACAVPSTWLLPVTRCGSRAPTSGQTPTQATTQPAAHLDGAAKVAPGLRVVLCAIEATLVLDHHLVQAGLAKVPARAAAVPAVEDGGGWGCSDDGGSADLTVALQSCSAAPNATVGCALDCWPATANCSTSPARRLPEHFKHLQEPVVGLTAGQRDPVLRWARRFKGHRAACIRRHAASWDTGIHAHPNSSTATSAPPGCPAAPPCSPTCAARHGWQPGKSPAFTTACEQHLAAMAGRHRSSSQAAVLKHLHSPPPPCPAAFPLTSPELKRMRAGLRKPSFRLRRPYVSRSTWAQWARGEGVVHGGWAGRRLGGAAKRPRPPLHP